MGLKRICTLLLIFSFVLCIYAFGFRDVLWANKASIENNKVDLAIPDQAIRLRVLANSDNPIDQALKRNVRDAIIGEIKSWSNKPKNIVEARWLISQKLSTLKRLSEQQVTNSGFVYPVTLKLGQVDFPTKLYGDTLYPAGDYEALLVTIGEGKGGNWWCVLFPPLCFLDMGSGDAVPADSEQLTAVANSATTALDGTAVVHKMEVRFFIVDKIKQLLSK